MVGPDTSKSPLVRSQTQISPLSAEVMRESRRREQCWIPVDGSWEAYPPELSG
jgi:hypothetical protein